MDVFDDNSDDDDFRAISDANYRKMEEKLTKLGYADGVADGEEKARQIGFDAGFADGLLTGFEIGKFECLFRMLKSVPNEGVEQLTALETEASMYGKLEIPETESAVHCKYLEHKDEAEAATISQHQNEYIRSIGELFKEKLPLSTEFLKKHDDKIEK